MIGKILAHYEVLERIGAGGMGEVYRARDHHLQRDVALKILPSGVVADGARKRFRQEALALSKLSHFNIATVFDFDTQHDVDFLAMELVRGMPLSERLKTGALPEPEVVRLGTQLAHGLAAAHGEGVIHRDVKPGNLMVGVDGQLKILDFGLAMLSQAADEMDATRSRVDSAVVAGTLPYMPPEQVRGLPADARSDVYAAGAVLYELATANRPFTQTQSGELIGAILHESPASPRSHNRQLSPRLERVIMKALAKEPSQRYQSAQELRVALEGLALESPSSPRSLTRAWLIAAGAPAAAIVLTALVIQSDIAGLRDRAWFGPTTDTSTRGTSTPPVRVRRSVAVLGFKNLSGRPDDQWLSVAIAEMLTTELAAGEHLRTIPGENIAQMKMNLSLTDTESYGRDTLSRIRENLGTDVVVLGSYLTLAGGYVRLDLRLQNTQAGETLAAVSERGSVSQLDDVVNRAGSMLREKLGVGNISATQALAVKAAMPGNVDAVRLYAEGLAKLRVFDHLGGRELLEKAVTADPENALIRSALASAWSSLGYDSKAKAEATRAFEFSGGLSRENQLVVEGKYRETTAEHARTIQVYRSLSEFFPDSLDYGLRLAAAQVSAGQGKAALDTVEALRRLPPPPSLDPRLDLAEASAAGLLSDFKRQQDAAARATAKGVGQRARLITARAQMAEGAAAQGLGAIDRAMSLYQNARTTFAAVGEGGGAARALRAIGSVHTERGEYVSASEALQQALAVQREIGDKSGVASTLYLLGVVRYRLVDYAAAKTLFTESLKIRQEIDDREGAADALNGLGSVLMDGGDAAGAVKIHEEGLAILREIGKKSGMARALNNLALALGALYDFPTAIQRAEEALAIRREIGERSGVSTTLRVLGSFAHDQGDLARAHKCYDEALAIQEDLNLKAQAAVTREFIAEVLLDEGQGSRAEAIVRPAVNEHRAAGALVREGFSLRVLAEAQLLQSKLAEAQASIDAAVRGSPRELSFLTTAARIRAASGRSADAIKSLEGIVAEAVKAHKAGAEFSARFALGEIEIKSGQSAQGRARLTALERDARAKGYLLLALQARALARRP